MSRNKQRQSVKRKTMQKDVDVYSRRNLAVKDLTYFRKPGTNETFEAYLSEGAVIELYDDAEDRRIGTLEFSGKLIMFVPVTGECKLMYDTRPENREDPNTKFEL